MDFWIPDWISGFHSGFLDFTVDFWISAWISGFQFGFLQTVYEISFVTDPSTITKRMWCIVGERERVVWSICVAQAVKYPFQSPSSQSTHNCEWYKII